MCGALAEEAAERQLVIIQRFNPGSPFERLFVFCPECGQGKHKAGGWMRLPEDAEGVTMNSLAEIPHQQKAYEAICAFVARPCYWVTLAGGVGTGKTEHIYAALNDLQSQGIYGQYWTMPELLDYLRDAIREDREDTAVSRLQRIAALPVLAVDELDKFNATGWAEEQLQKLFNARHQNRRTVGTLIGYNLEGDDKIPSFLRSRMHDGRYRFVKMIGPDIRPAIRSDPEIDRPEEIWRRNP